MKILAILFISILLSAQVVVAQDSTSTQLGKITYIEGSVKILKDGKFWVPITIGSEVYHNNTIKTGIGALAEIDWINGSKSKVGPNSELSILDLYESSGKNVKAKTANLWGGFVKVFSADATASKQEEGGIRRSMAEVRSKPGKNELYWKENKEVDFQEASDMYQKKEYSKSAVLFDQFLAQKPRDKNAQKARFALAHCYVEMNNPVKAKQLLIDFIERYPDGELTETAKLVLESL